LARAVAAREAACEGGPAPEVFVLLPESSGGVRQLAERVRTTSPEAFWAWLKANRAPRTDDLLAAASVEPASERVDESPSLWVVDEESSELPEPLERLVTPHTGFCPFHHCDPMFCFCWD
jgi:hypothetical protein